MKIAVIIVRILMGLLLMFASVVYFLKLFPEPEMQGDVKVFNMGIKASGYLMPVVKMVELLCSIAFITGLFVPLATILIFPITLNILFYHAFLAPESLPIAILLLLGNLFIAYYYRDKYKPMLTAK